MHIIVLVVFFLLSFRLSAQQFDPIPENSKTLYRFNLEDNFFKTENDYLKSFNSVTASVYEVNALLRKKNKTIPQWVAIFQKYNNTEAAYRKIDLYLFLRYAVNMKDEIADKQSDSLRYIIRTTRLLLKEKIAELSASERAKLVLTSPQLDFYVNSVVREKPHLLSSDQDKMLTNFQYLKSSSFYDKIIATLSFEKVVTKDEEIDVYRQTGAWQYHPDEKIRKEGEIKLFNGFAKQREAFGINYINYIRGLHAFSKSKMFSSLLEEKLFNYQISGTMLNNIFKTITESANKRSKTNSTPLAESPARFTITEATEILKKAFAVLGNEYNTEIANLLDPAKGRIDISGGENRIPIRGTASVYPVYPSIFYAYNYEGYIIDLTLLAHEAGHAVQASLMANNKVPLMYASGPGYFTESFGKFNELLLFDYLSRHEKDSVKQKLYSSELKERMEVLYGSAAEAYIEYSLINGVIENKITSPDDLDSITYKAGSAISPVSYIEMPERKNLWMLMETNFREPLHNINDMIASALAIKYFQLYKSNGGVFIQSYLKLLKEGYYSSPANLLKKVNIDLQEPGFMNNVIEFIDSYRH